MNTADSTEPSVVALVRDLMFVSKITVAARAAGTSVKMVRAASLLDAVGGRRLIVDLAEPNAIEAAVAWKQRTGGEAVGFVAHVDELTIGRAAEAGIDRVVSRGTFSERIDGLVRLDTPLIPAPITDPQD